MTARSYKGYVAPLAGVVLFATSLISIVLIGRSLPDLHLPLRVFGFPRPGIDVPTQIALGALAIVQSAALFALIEWFPKRWSRASAAWVAILALALAFVACRATFFGSDTYYYIFFGKSESLAAAYERVPRPKFQTNFESIEQMLLVPVDASSYGPVWQALDIAVVGPATTPQSAGDRLRWLNTFALLVFFAGVIASRLSPAVTAALICCPALYYEYVVSAHNDICALAALAWIRPLLARERVAAAIGVAALAGAMKVTLGFVAAATLAQISNLRTRFLASGALIAVTVAISYALGGVNYFRAIVVDGLEERSYPSSDLTFALHSVLQNSVSIAVLLVTALALFRREVYRFAGYLYVGLSGLPHAWYVPWGTGYALMRERELRTFVVSMPIIAYIIDNQLHDQLHLPFTSSLLTAITVLLAIQIVGRLHRRPDLNA